MNEGLYEQLITKLINIKINELDKNSFQVKKTTIDKAEAVQLLSQHIGKTIKYSLNLVKGDDILERQIEISNKILLFLKQELKNEIIEDDLIETEGSKPMNIKWELNEPIPNYLWKESAKMSVG